MNLKELSDALQLSPSTVSKALNNCFGVDAATRSRILDAARKAGYAPRRDAAAIDCILPDAPSYFWRPLFSGLRTVEADCRFHILSSLTDTGTALTYLRQAAQRGSRVLIVSVPMTPEIRDMLAAYARQALVILLTQYGDIPHTVYVGEEAYRTGKELGAACAAHLPGQRRIVSLESSPAHITTRRADGFQEAVTAAGARIVGTITRPEAGPALASCLARELHDRFGDGFDCVYCNDGVLYHVALAIEKLKQTGRVVCVGYEYEKRNQKYIDNGVIAAYAEQDPYAQGKLAMKIAAHYLKTATFPDSKFVYVPSVIRVNPLYTGG